MVFDVRHSRAIPAPDRSSRSLTARRFQAFTLIEPLKVSAFNGSNNSANIWACPDDSAQRINPTPTGSATATTDSNGNPYPVQSYDMAQVSTPAGRISDSPWPLSPRPLLP